MIDVYRISACRYNEDLTGYGASLYGGRWNSKGTYILYTSLTPSLAMLELVAHLSSVIREDYCLATIRIPSDKILIVPENTLPDGWSDYPAPSSLKGIGDRFVQSNHYLALQVPSAVLKLESNLLINPNHPDFKHVKLLTSEGIPIDRRFVENKK